MTLTQIWESPHGANPDTEAHAGQDVLRFVSPLGSVADLLLFHPFQILIVQDPALQPRVRNHQSHACSDKAGEMLTVSFV